jgi:predicted DNA-binding transcriptional regulator AlpA
VAGRHVTNHQMRLNMKLRMTETPPVSAAKSGFSPATAYRFENDPRFPSERQTLRKRRRPDPLADIFDAEIVSMLETELVLENRTGC